MEQHPGEFHYSNLCRRHPISFDEQLPLCFRIYILKMISGKKGINSCFPADSHRKIEKELL
jgi:hypothetical protein